MTVAEAQDIWLKMLGLEACRLEPSVPNLKAGGVITRSELLALGQGQASVPNIKPSPSSVWAPLPLL